MQEAVRIGAWAKSGERPIFVFPKSRKNVNNYSPSTIFKVDFDAWYVSFAWNGYGYFNYANLENFSNSSITVSKGVNTSYGPTSFQRLEPNTRYKFSVETDSIVNIAIATLVDRGDGNAQFGSNISGGFETNSYEFTTRGVETIAYGFIFRVTTGNPTITYSNMRLEKV